ncbi:MAG: hypothetical protein ACREBR_01865 [bacterium]
MNNLERQSISLDRNTDALMRKEGRSFAATFKANSECPKFNGKDKNWNDFKRQFKSYLGTHELGHLLKSEETDPSKPLYDEAYHEKNIWLHHILMNNVGRTALSYTKNKKDLDGDVIPDGLQLWTQLSDWYEGENNKASMARMARAN